MKKRFAAAFVIAIALAGFLTISASTESASPVSTGCPYLDAVHSTTPSSMEACPYAGPRDKGTASTGCPYLDGRTGTASGSCPYLDGSPQASQDEGTQRVARI